MKVSTQVIAAFLGLAVVAASEASAVTISGQVLLDGLPLRGAKIYASGGLKSAITNSQGLYAITAPDSGTFTLSPLPTSQLVPEPLSQSVVVSGADIANINFTFRKTSSTRVIYGRIVSGYAPIPGVDVTIIGKAAVQTDENGIFVFPEAPPGRYYLYARKEGITFAPPLVEALLTSNGNRGLLFAGFSRLAADDYSTWLSGLWNMSLAVVNTDCPTQETGLGGTTGIYQIKNKVAVRLAKIGTFYGTAGNMTFSGQGRGRRLFCGTSGSMNAAFLNPDEGSVSGSFVVSCFLKPPCTVNFTGGITRK